MMLLHGFQQCALNFGRRAVDFIRQNDVGEDRPLTGGKLPGFGIEDHRADQVGRQKIRRKLNTRKLGVDGSGQRLDNQGLGESWNAFHQDMTVAEHGNKQAVDNIFLADNRAGHCFIDSFDKFTFGFHLLIDEFYFLIHK